VEPVRKAVALLVLAIAAAACTGSKSTPTTPGGSTSTPPTSSGPAIITPGAFEYQNGGLDVTLELKTNTGTMVVDNGSGHDLGKPDLYVFLATGKQVDGKVTDAAPISDGAKQTFHVEFPPEVTDKTVGLVILLFGSDNYGAFAPA
jgi:hypothetical protein